MMRKRFRRTNILLGLLHKTRMHTYTQTVLLAEYTIAKHCNRDTCLDSIVSNHVDDWKEFRLISPNIPKSSSQCISKHHFPHLQKEVCPREFSNPLDLEFSAITVTVLHRILLKFSTLHSFTAQ